MFQKEIFLEICYWPSWSQNTLSKPRKYLLDICKEHQTSNFISEEWKGMSSLADDRNLVIKKEDRGLFVVVWHENDNFMETDKQLNDQNVLEEV